MMLTAIACSEIPEDERLVYVEPPAVNRAVLIEDFTGQRCVNCPNAIIEIEQLEQQYGKENVIAVGIHSGPLAVWNSDRLTGLRTQVGDTYYDYWQVEVADAYEVDGLTRRAVESGDVAQLLSTLERNAKSGKPGLVTSACGEQAIITLLLMLDKGYDIRHILYQNSGDIDNHDPSRVVGYHSFAIYRKNKGTSKTANTAAADSTSFTLTDAEKATLKEIAMGSLRHALSGAAPVSPKLTPALRRNCGAFVSLMKGGNLRGCIGHFGEDTPLYEMVHEMALAAAFEDPRFPELRKEELPDIEVEISVLTPMRRIHSLDELQLGRHGIYIRKGMRSGTFLPQVADQMGWTKEEFVGYCSQEKAHIGWNGWRDAELYVYEAIVF